MHLSSTGRYYACEIYLKYSEDGCRIGTMSPNTGPLFAWPLVNFLVVKNEGPDLRVRKPGPTCISPDHQAPPQWRLRHAHYTTV